MNNKFIFSILLFFVFLTFGGCGNTEKASLVLKNTKVYTIDSKMSVAEAVAVKNEKIIFVGSNEEVEKYISATTHIIELEDGVVLPGLVDSQGHMLQLGQKLTELDISQTNSFEEIIEIVKLRVKNTEPGKWIIGGRWDQNNWENKDFPSHKDLSKASPENPVFLMRVDGYAALVNDKAMKLAGIDRNTPDPFGGKIIRDHKGNPTGVLVNRAVNLVQKFIPGESDDSYKEKILKGMNDCLSKGLTGWHQIGATSYEISLMKDLIDQNKFKMRTTVFWGEQDKPIPVEEFENKFAEIKLDNYKNFLSVKGIQLYYDGAMGSRGAALFEPYNDDPKNIGLLRLPPGYIEKITLAALKSKMIINTSCIGTRANHFCINEYEDALTLSGITDHRLRLTHAQVLLPEDIKRIGKLNIIPSMQPIHATSDKSFIIDRIGTSRMKGAYAWNSILQSGAIIACGSDFPVETNNPFLSIYAAITRKDADGNPNGGWYPEESMTLEEVIKGFTIWSAYIVFKENDLGSVEVGKFADFTVIDKDIFNVQPEEIISTNVLYTIVNGEIVYSKN